MGDWIQMSINLMAKGGCSKAAEMDSNYRVIACRPYFAGLGKDRGSLRFSPSASAKARSPMVLFRRDPSQVDPKPRLKDLKGSTFNLVVISDLRHPVCDSAKAKSGEVR